VTGPNTNQPLADWYRKYLRGLRGLPDREYLRGLRGFPDREYLIGLRGLLDREYLRD